LEREDGGGNLFRTSPDSLLASVCAAPRWQKVDDVKAGVERLCVSGGGDEVVAVVVVIADKEGSAPLPLRVITDYRVAGVIANGAKD